MCRKGRSGGGGEREIWIYVSTSQLTKWLIRMIVVSIPHTTPTPTSANLHKGVDTIAYVDTSRSLCPSMHALTHLLKDERITY